MSASLRDLQPDLQPWARALVDAAGAAGLQPRVTSTFRSHADQVRLYRRYLAGGSPYPANRPGTSSHEYGWAFDVVVSPMSALSELGALWESWGGVWGGRPQRAGSQYDPIHFEFPGWRQTVDWQQPDQRAATADPVQTVRDVIAQENPYGELGAAVTDALYFGTYDIARAIGEAAAGLLK